MIGRMSASTLRQRMELTSQMEAMYAIVGKVNQMKNKDIDYSRHKICNLLYELAAKNDEIESLKATNKVLEHRIGYLNGLLENVCNLKTIDDATVQFWEKNRKMSSSNVGKCCENEIGRDE